MMKEQVASAGYHQALDNLVKFGYERYEDDVWEKQSEELREDWLRVIDAVLEAMQEYFENEKSSYDFGDGTQFGDGYNHAWEEVAELMGLSKTTFQDKP